MTNTLPTVKEYSKATYKSPSTIYSRLKTNLLYSTSEGKRKRLTQAYLNRYGALDGFGNCTFDDLADLAQELPDCAELELLRLHNNGSKVLLPPVKEASAREVVLYSLRHKDIAEDVLVLLCWAAKERYPAMFKALYNSLTADDYNRQEAAEKAEKILEHPLFSALIGEHGREELGRQIRIAEADKTLGIFSVVVGGEEHKQIEASIDRQQQLKPTFPQPPEDVAETTIDIVAETLPLTYETAVEQAKAKGKKPPTRETFYFQQEAQEQAAIESAVSGKKVKPKSKAQMQREYRAQMDAAQAVVDAVDCSMFTADDFMAWLDRTEDDMQLRFIETKALSEYLRREICYCKGKSDAEVAVIEGKLKEAYKKVKAHTEVRVRLMQTTEQVIGGLVVELRADESFRVRIQPGIYSSRYTTEDIEQLEKDFPTLAQALVMEGYRALPRVRLGDETIVNLNGTPVREHNGLVYLDDVLHLFTEEN